MKKKRNYHKSFDKKRYRPTPKNNKTIVNNKQVETQMKNKRTSSSVRIFYKQVL